MPHPFRFFLRLRGPQQFGVPGERFLLAGVKGPVFVVGVINGWDTSDLMARKRRPPGRPVPNIAATLVSEPNARFPELN